MHCTACTCKVHDRSEKCAAVNLQMATSSLLPTTSAFEDTYAASSSYDTDQDCNSNHDNPDQPRPSKITKRKGAATYKTKLNKAWLKTWLFVCEVRDDALSFHCTICKRNVSCSHMGKRDVERHIGLAIHQANVKSAKSQPMLSFQLVSSTLLEKVRYIYSIVYIST